MKQSAKSDELTHKAKLPLKDRMEESEEFGEQVRTKKNGGDQLITKDENKLKDSRKKDQDIKVGDSRQSR